MWKSGHAGALRRAIGPGISLRAAGPLVALTGSVSSRALLDRRVGFRELLGAAGGFACGGLAEVRLTKSPAKGLLPPPLSALVACDGRALAWFGEGRACIVHPTLAELCHMHGVDVEATLAA